jgi:hypothetical protein
MPTPKHPVDIAEEPTQLVMFFLDALKAHDIHHDPHKARESVKRKVATDTPVPPTGA